MPFPRTRRALPLLLVALLATSGGAAAGPALDAILLENVPHALGVDGAADAYRDALRARSEALVQAQQVVNECELERERLRFAAQEAQDPRAGAAALETWVALREDCIERRAALLEEARAQGQRAQAAQRGLLVSGSLTMEGREAPPAAPMPVDDVLAALVLHR